jgi:hypothetical protein
MEPVCDYLAAMLRLPPPALSIELPRSSYRSFDRMPRWRRWLNCIRHPIRAFVTYQIVNPDPPTARDQAIGLAAIVHGLMAWMLTTHT